MTITQEELKKLLHYDPETGLFFRISKGRGISTKKPAGCTKTKESGKKYVSLIVNGLCIKAHRLAWFYVTGSWPDKEIDHINGDGTDNRFINLRDVGRIENCRNQRRPKNNTSGICGVHFVKSRNKWQAVITINKYCEQLGYFDNIFDAACTRKNAEIKYGFHKNHGSDRPL